MQHLTALVGQLLSRVNALQARIDELETWLAEVADDMMERTGV